MRTPDHPGLGRFNVDDGRVGLLLSAQPGASAVATDVSAARACAELGIVSSVGVEEAKYIVEPSQFALNKSLLSIS